MHTLSMAAYRMYGSGYASLANRSRICTATASSTAMHLNPVLGRVSKPQSGGTRPDIVEDIYQVTKFPCTSPYL